MVAGLVCAGTIAVLTGSPADAHALLTASSPTDGATLDKAPTEVVLTFTEALDPNLTVIHVLDSSGNRVETGRTEIPGQPNRARVPLGPLAKGSYTITWRTTSTTDGHTTVGSVAFGVGVAVEAAGTTGPPSGVRSPTLVSIAGRWLFYTGIVLLLGAAVVGLFVSTRTVVSVWALNASWAAAAIGLVLTIADQRATTHTSMSGLLHSSTGHKLQDQAIAVGLTWLAVSWASLRPSRAAVAAVGLGASGVMLERALSGHADSTTTPAFTVTVQWLHLVSIGAWIGGLVWLLIALRQRDPGRGPGLARRFSKVAGVMVGLVFLTGTVRALDEVGAWSRLFNTSFGVTLSVKIGIFAVLVALGAASRFRHVAPAGEGRADGLRRTVRVEVAVAAAALAAAAVLTGLAPSRTVAEAERLQKPAGVTVTGSDYATSVRVRLLVTPGTVGPNRFEAAVVDYDSGQPASADSVTLRLQLNDRADVGAAEVALVRDPDARWRGTSSALSIDGKWSVTALVQSSSDSVEVPMELVAGRRPG
jgi:copper transport protein